MLVAAITVVFPLCMAYAAFSDMFTMTIPNRVSLILAVVFVLAAPFTGMDWVTFSQHFLVALVVFSVCFGLFAAGVMGGGDAKFLTATSLWFGLNAGLISFLMSTAIVGGVLTIIVLLFRTDRFSVVVGRIGLISHLTDPKLGVPYGIAIGTAGLIGYPTTALMQYVIGTAV